MKYNAPPLCPATSRLETQSVQQLTLPIMRPLCQAILPVMRLPKCGARSFSHCSLDMPWWETAPPMWPLQLGRRGGDAMWQPGPTGHTTGCTNYFTHCWEVGGQIWWAGVVHIKEVRHCHGEFCTITWPSMWQYTQVQVVHKNPSQSPTCLAVWSWISLNADRGWFTLYPFKSCFCDGLIHSNQYWTAWPMQSTSSGLSASLYLTAWPMQSISRSLKSVHIELHNLHSLRPLQWSPMHYKCSCRDLCQIHAPQVPGLKHSSGERHCARTAKFNPDP